MRLYFIDGMIDLQKIPVLPKDFIIIDAMEGVSENWISANGAKKHHPNATIITNQIILLNWDGSWNEEKKKREIFLWDRNKKRFKDINKLTDKEIRKAHNIEKMYFAGAFDIRPYELTEP